MVVVEKEAKIIRLIYDLYLKGYGCRKIKSYLEKNDIKTVTGKSEWSTSTIDQILSNEKYVGTALSQKSYVSNCLTHKQVKTTVSCRCILLRIVTKPLLTKKFLKKSSVENLRKA